VIVELKKFTLLNAKPVIILLSAMSFISCGSGFQTGQINQNTSAQSDQYTQSSITFERGGSGNIHFVITPNTPGSSTFHIHVNYHNFAAANENFDLNSNDTASVHTFVKNLFLGTETCHGNPPPSGFSGTWLHATFVSVNGQSNSYQHVSCSNASALIELQNWVNDQF
jgi:hypothetical protein